MKLAIKDIYFDKDIYPRENPNQSVIEDYEETLIAGKTFPPIVVQKVVYIEGGKENIKNAIVDGVHRHGGVESFNKNSKKNNTEKIESMEVIYHTEQTVRSDDKVAMSGLIVDSARYNAQHGCRLTKKDMRSDARKIYILNPKFKQAELADILGVPRTTLQGWISDLEEADKASEDAIILKLNLLGWTQEEIGKAVGKAQNTIHDRLSELSNSTKPIKQELEKANTPEKISDIAKYRKIEQITALAVKFDGSSDEARMGHDLLKCSSRPYDVWNFSDCMPYCGSEYPGRIPGQLVMQSLFFYTKPGDLVVDPMGGSGTTIDACLLMGRKCYAFDSNPESKRAKESKDLIIKDAIEGLKGLKSKPDLIFLDPPYFKKVDNGYSDASISRMDKDAYMKFFEEFAETARKSLKKGGRMAFLMSDYTPLGPKDEQTTLFLHHYIRIFEAAGFEVERVIQCPLSTQQIHPDFINKYREERKLARLSRNLVVFK